MNNRHRKTLAAVFSEPTPGNVAWADVEALLLACGCKVIEGAGSRVRFVLNQAVLAVHRPHPHKEAKRYLVRDVRDFLKANGFVP